MSWFGFLFRGKEQRKTGASVKDYKTSRRWLRAIYNTYKDAIGLNLVNIYKDAILVHILSCGESETGCDTARSRLPPKFVISEITKSEMIRC